MLVYSKVYGSHVILKVIMANIKVAGLKLQKHGCPADFSGKSVKATFQKAQVHYK